MNGKNIMQMEARTSSIVWDFLRCFVPGLLLLISVVTGFLEMPFMAAISL